MPLKTVCCKRYCYPILKARNHPDSFQVSCHAQTELAFCARWRDASADPREATCCHLMQQTDIRQSMSRLVAFYIVKSKFLTLPLSHMLIGCELERCARHPDMQKLCSSASFNFNFKIREKRLRRAFVPRHRATWRARRCRGARAKPPW